MSAEAFRSRIKYECGLFAFTESFVRGAGFDSKLSLNDGTFTYTVYRLDRHSRCQRFHIRQCDIENALIVNIVDLFRRLFIASLVRLFPIMLYGAKHWAYIGDKIDALNLQYRHKLALRRANIRTVLQLIRAWNGIASQRRKIPGLGTMGIERIEERLWDYGLLT